jgi:flagellar protein FlbD
MGEIVRRRDRRARNFAHAAGVIVPSQDGGDHASHCANSRGGGVIQLSRLRHGDAIHLNPDLFERVDTHVDTVIKLTDGTEYVVSESADEIVRRIIEFRARILAFAALLQSAAMQGPFEPGERPTSMEALLPSGASPWAPSEESPS